MGKYIIKRILTAIPLLIIISFITFFLINLSPVDPVESIIRARGIPQASDEMIQAERERMGLDKPLLVRYGNWIKKCAKLDFGESYCYSKTVAELILPAFANTMKLVGVTTIVVILISILLGVICALTAGTFVDHGIRLFMVALSAMPSYWIAILLIYWISVKLNVLPTSGMEGPLNYILPVTVLAIHYLGFYFRLIRVSMIKNKLENYVIYERSCGISEWRIILHMMRNSMQTAVSAFCMAIPGLMAGSVVVENIFAWPGIGRLCISAIKDRDIPVIQTYILIIAVAFIFFNLIADVISAMMNPRLREG